MDEFGGIMLLAADFTPVGLKSDRGYPRSRATRRRCVAASAPDRYRTSFDRAEAARPRVGVNWTLRAAASSGLDGRRRERAEHCLGER